MKFEFDGDKYAGASAHQKEWGQRIIGELGLKGNERILDLGCGDGALTAYMADLVAQGSVLGIDYSRGMIDAAVKNKRNNLSFLLKDINELDYTDEFDLVFSNAVLHWIKDHDRLLKSIYASLKKDGIIRFNFGSEGNCIHFLKVIRQAMALPQFSGYFVNFEWPWYMPGVAEYQSIIDRHPFRDVKLWGENADRYFPDTEAMVKWVDQPSLVPFLQFVEPSAKQEFRDFVVRRMIEETFQLDGTCFETFRRINVFARRED
jgi:trans-aconitate 2-methyltransferase